MGEPIYDAFISYKYAQPDRRVAERLRRILEHFRIPKALRQGRPEKLRCFLDREELSASPDLSETLKLALSRSRFLIVVCSPEAATSEWIAREIQFFQEAGRRDKILVVLLAGTPGTSIPRALGTPLYLDVRAPAASKSVKALRANVSQLVAPILGCDLDDLIQRQKKEQRARGLMAALVSLSVLVAFGVLAWFAIEQRRVKEQEQRIAVARQLTTEVLSPKEQQAGLLPVDILLAIESLRFSPTGEARSYLRDAVRRLARLRGQISDVQVNALAFAEAAPNAPPIDGVRDVEVDGHVVRIAYGKDADQPVALTELRLAEASDGVTVWDLTNGTEVARIRRSSNLCGHGVNRMTFGAYEELLGIAGVDGDLAVWDISTESESLWLDLGTPFDPERDIANVRCDEPVKDVAFSPDGTIIASSNPDGTTRIWNIETGKQIALITNEEVLSLAFSHNGELLATGGQDGSVRIWATGPWQDREQVSTDSFVRVWDQDRWQEVARINHAHAVNALAFSSNDRFLATASADHSARLWNVDDTYSDYRHRRYRGDIAGQRFSQAWQVQRLPEVLRMTHDGAVTSVAISPDDQRIATIDENGHVRVWEATPRPAANRDDQTLIAEACSSLTRNLTAAEWRKHMGNAPYRKTCANLP